MEWQLQKTNEDIENDFIAQPTSEKILNRKDGSASILFRSIEHDFIAKPRGQIDPCNSNIIN